jgi:hypothetical protein
MYRNQEQRDFARELRNNATPAETRSWRYLQAGKLGVKFRRQAAIGAYIVDFVCLSHRLIVELDGPQHFDGECQVHDARRFCPPANPFFAEDSRTFSEPRRAKSEKNSVCETSAKVVDLPELGRTDARR